MNTGTSELQWGHRILSACVGGMARSYSQVLHLKCIMGVMKPLLVMLLLATSLQAQTVVDAARKERDRQAKVHSTIVIIEKGPESAPPASDDKSKEAPKLPEVDATALWNAKADLLRTKIKELQDQETALQLKQTEQQNLVYAPVVDPAVKDQAQTDLTQTIQDLAKVRDDLATSKSELDTMNAEGPPKKSPAQP